MQRDMRLSTGCDVLDSLLGGGFEIGAVTQLYGPPGSGKTNIAMSTVVSAAADGGNAVVIDTEGLSMARFEQLMNGYEEPNEELSSRVVVQEVYDFAGQDSAIREVEKLATEADVIVLDSATGFYRLERDEDDDNGAALRQIARQITKLLGVARKHDLAVVITNQVYSDLEGEHAQPLGGHTMAHWTGAVIRVEELSDERRATVEKHRAQEEGVTASFEITDTGLESTGRQDTIPLE